MLEARRLTKRYASLPAVRDVSFSIAAGEILGYLGPNGSGKSTTVKMLAGLLDPTSGEVLFRGSRIQEDLNEYKRRLGYVPEEANLYSFLTGWEYLELVASLRQLHRQRFAEKAGSLLNSLSMFQHRHSLIGSYSKGMRQRIVLIAAMMHDPDLLVLDEPFSGLDVTSALVVREAIRLLAQSGRAVFFSSPVLEVMEKLCTHLVILRRGQLVISGTMDEIRASTQFPELERAFLQFTDQVDAGHLAQEIADAVRAPIE